jgi:hypothetical protein
VISYVSLGAGNTGRKVDLETDLRIAEFEFVRWQGGRKASDKHSLFKGFYEMAESATLKGKFLCVLGTEHVDKLFNGVRAISSVLSRHVRLRNEFSEKHGTP